MVEDMYQQELKEAEGGAAEDGERNQSSSNNSGHQAQSTPTRSTTTPATTSTATAPPPPPQTSTTPTSSAPIESDPSLAAINRQGFSENQAKQANSTTNNTAIMAPITTASGVAPPVSQCLDSELPPHNISMATEDTCRHGSLVSADYGTASAAAASDIASSTLIRFGTTPGDVSLTLGLRHAGNMPEKTPFSVRDFGGI